MIQTSLMPEALHDQFVQGDPFPHVVVDDFFEPELAEELVTALESSPIETWYVDDHENQRQKWTMGDPSRLPAVVASTLAQMNSLDRPVQVIEPVLNRMVVFRIRDDAFHAVRSPIRCPPEVMRYSLALYYYTVDRPEEEKADFHWASWQEPRVAEQDDGAETPSA